MSRTKRFLTTASLVVLIVSLIPLPSLAQEWPIVFEEYFSGALATQWTGTGTGAHGKIESGRFVTVGYSDGLIMSKAAFSGDYTLTYDAEKLDANPDQPTAGFMTLDVVNAGDSTRRVGWMFRDTGTNIREGATGGESAFASGADKAIVRGHVYNVKLEVTGAVVTLSLKKSTDAEYTLLGTRTGISTGDSMIRFSHSQTKMALDNIVVRIPPQLMVSSNIDNEKQVDVTVRPVYLDFDADVNPATLTGGGVSVEDSAGNSAGFDLVSVTARRVRLDFTGALLPNEPYTIRLAQTVAGLNGSTLAAGGKTFAFRTAWPLAAQDAFDGDLGKWTGALWQIVQGEAKGTGELALKSSAHKDAAITFDYINTNTSADDPGNIFLYFRKKGDRQLNLYLTKNGSNPNARWQYRFAKGSEDLPVIDTWIFGYPNYPTFDLNVKYNIKVILQGDTVTMLYKRDTEDAYTTIGSLGGIPQVEGDFMINASGAQMVLDNFRMYAPVTLGADLNVADERLVAPGDQLRLSFSHSVSAADLNGDNIAVTRGGFPAEASFAADGGTGCVITLAGGLVPASEYTVSVKNTLKGVNGETLAVDRRDFTFKTAFPLAFSDDFSRDLSGWADFEGYALEAGRMVSEGAGRLRTNGAYTHQMLEFDVKKTAAEQSAGGRLSVHMRGVSDADKSMIFFDPQWIHGMASGGEDVLLGAAGDSPHVGVTYTVRMILIDNKIELYMKKDGESGFTFYGALGNVPVKAGYVSFVASGCPAEIDNVRIYEGAALDYTLSAPEKLPVGPGTEVELVFNQDVQAAGITTDNITVAAQGQPSVSAAVTRTAPDRVKLTFPQALEYDTAYTVSVSQQVKSVQGGVYSQGGKALVTQSAPMPVEVGSLSYWKQQQGQADADITQSGLATGTIRVKLMAENTTSSGMAPYLILGLYDVKNGAALMKNVTLTPLSIAAGEEKEVSGVIDVDALQPGSELRVYIWNGIEEIKPVSHWQIFTQK